MLFLLMLKSLIALRAFGTMVTSTTLLADSLSKLFWPMVNYHRSFLLYMIRSSTSTYFLSQRFQVLS